MNTFITPAELAAHKDEYTIIDVRGLVAYGEGHIEGAFCLDIDEDLSGPVSTHGGRHPLPTAESFAHKLSTFGLDMDTKLVIYDEWLTYAGRAWWMCRHLMGMHQVQVLAGGVQAWIKEGLGLTKELTPLPEATKLDYNADPMLLAFHDEVAAVSRNGDRILVDARAPERYDGSVPDTIDGMTGHIPGAINIFWQSCFTQEGPKRDDELQVIFKDLLTSSKGLIVYCGSGVTAPNLMLAMDQIGLSAQLYVGSSSDWMTYPEAPLQKGVESVK